MVFAQCVYNVCGQTAACIAGLGDYQCNNGHGCYYSFQKCDSYNECDDKSDDLNCEKCNIYNTFYCPSSRQCVSKDKVCDGSQDCLNGEDEDVTYCSIHCVSGVGDYQCNDGNGCYSDFDKCNYYNTCDDKSDDLNCDSCTGTLSFYCPSSRQCVSTFMVCDGNLDCLNGEDEGEPAGCLTPCTDGTGGVQCNDGNGCYDLGQKCDVFNECDDKSDELGCDKGCNHPHYFVCPSNLQCIDRNLVCDGHLDCLNGDDEDATYCPTIWNYWSRGQMAGMVIGFVIYLVTVIVMVVVVHKRCKK
ncbi:sortilin-related receptor-like [Asterias rubens]|uniref:sortilin-related receptor-like n=1 Tax=Asterias rubens TaxID=7604 RepID=UPI0014554378|nr:sortilin-related receptor-like [Asterias rubens]